LAAIRKSQYISASVFLFSRRPLACTIRACVFLLRTEANHGHQLFSPDQPQPAGPAPVGNRGPDRLDRVCAPLRSAYLPLVPQMESPGSRCPGRNPSSAAEARREDAHLRLRSRQTFSGLSENADSQRLV